MALKFYVSVALKMFIPRVDGPLGGSCREVLWLFTSKNYDAIIRDFSERGHTLLLVVCEDNEDGLKQQQCNLKAHSLSLSFL